jgi:hypothetical protein
VCPRAEESVAPTGIGTWDRLAGAATPLIPLNQVHLFIRIAELQIAVLQMAVFGGAGGCVFCNQWVHVSTAWVLPQVADGGTAFSMEGSGEYIE